MFKKAKEILCCSIFSAFSASAFGVTIEAAPTAVGCIVEGTGSGTCDIIFPASVNTGCSNNTRVNFNPNTDVLGSQIYSMALAAVSAQKTIYVGIARCNSLGKAEVDTISFKQ